MRRKKRKTGKILFTILIVAALCVAGAFVYEYFIAEKPEKKATEEITTSETKSESKPTTTPEQKPKTEENQVIGKEQVVQYEGEDPNNSDSITGAITYAGVASQTLIVRLNINQYLGSGTCNLSLIKDNTPYYSTSADIIADVSTSTCQGFNIPISNLPSGAYSIVVTLVSGDKAGTITGGVNL